jgi:hypothetical protein
VYSRLPPEFGETPTKVVFEGVEPGSAEAQRLYHERISEISSFHQKARQNRMISESPTSSMQQALPNGDQLRYTFNNGVENIHVRLSTKSRGGEAARRSDQKRPWDFALIELTLPDMTKTAAVFGAFETPRGHHDEGVAADDNGGRTFSDNPYLEFASGTEEILATIPGMAPQISSLKVDLTKVRGNNPVDIDLYGFIRVYSEPGTTPTDSGRIAEVMRSYTTFGGSRPHGQEVLHERVLFPIASTDVIVALFPELSSVRLYVPGEHNIITNALTGTAYEPLGYPNWGPDWAQDPPSWISQFGGAYSEVTEYYVPGVIKSIKRIGSQWRVYGAGTWTPGPPPSGGYSPGVQYEFEGWCYEQYFGPLYEPVPQYISRTGQLTAVFFQGSPMDSVSYYPYSDIGKFFYRWENKATYPGRWNSKVISTTVPLHTIDPPIVTSIENHFGMPYLGRVRLDADNATAKWLPA